MQDQELKKKMFESIKIFKFVKDLLSKRKLCNSDLEIVLGWSLDLYFYRNIDLGERNDLQKLMTLVLSLNRDLKDQLNSEFITLLTSLNQEKILILTYTLGWEEVVVQGLIKTHFTKIWQGLTKCENFYLKEPSNVLGKLDSLSERKLLSIQRGLKYLINNFKGFFLNENINQTQNLINQLVGILHSSEIYKENQKLAGILLMELSYSCDCMDWMELLNLSRGYKNYSTLGKVGIVRLKPLENRYSILSVWRGVFLLNSTEIMSIKFKDEQVWEFSFKAIMEILENSSGLIHALAIQTLLDWFLAVQEFNIETQIYETILMIIEKLQLPFENVKENLKSLFRTILGLKCFQKVQDKVLELLVNLDPLSRSRFDMLTLFVARHGTKDILRNHMTLIDQAFKFLTIIPHPTKILQFICQLIISSSVSVEEGIPSSYWWCDLIITHLFCEQTRKLVGEGILLSVFKQRPAIFSGFQLAMQKHKHREHYLYAQLALIKAAHANNMADIFTKDSFYVNQVLRPILRSQDLSLRIDGWIILTGHVKGLSDFSLEELNLIKEALIIDINNQNQNYKSEFFAGIKKALIRLKAVIYALHRNIIRTEKYLSDFICKDADRLEQDQEKSKLQDKMDFLNWVQTFMIMSLFPGASVQRSSSALEFISIIFEWNDSLISQLTESDLNHIPGFPNFFDDRLCQSLLHFIIHSDYEPDRRKAFILLQRFNNFELFDSLHDHHRMVWKLLNSKHQSQIEGGILMSMVVFDSLKENATDFVNTVLQILESNIRIAEQSLWKCALENPIYPFLSVLKSLMENKVIDVDINLVVKLVDRAIQSVLVVCADDSPEGNLPSSFKDIQLKIEALILSSESESIDLQSKSQLISHQCFRTLKEATNFLVTILKNSLRKIPDNNYDRINYGMISNFGDIFCDLLAVVRHRGAISAVCASFEEFIIVLLQSKNEAFEKLVEKWLDNFFGYITSGGTSYTRRSAGFPTAIYAIVGTTDFGRKFLLPKTMDKLFNIAKEPVPLTSSEKVDLPQVHALNVIRAILLHSETIHGTKHYIENALCICFESFSSVFFPIRNSATMLFTVLVSKGLKSKESKSGVHFSGVTGREFFTAHPNLRRVIVDFLALSVIEFKKGQIHPTLFPILILISKLRPSSLMSQFPDLKDPIVKCLGFPTFKVRELAVKSILPLTCVTDLIRDAINFLNSQTFHLNLIHGYLLLLTEILIKFETKDIAFEIQKHCDKWVWIDLIDCDIVQSIYFKLCLRTYFGVWKNQERFESRKNFWILSRDGLKKSVHDKILSYGSLTAKTEIYLQGIDEFQDFADIKIFSLISHPFYEVQIATFAYLRNFGHLHKSFNLQEIIDSSLTLLISQNTKEILQCASDFLAMVNLTSENIRITSGMFSAFEECLISNRLVDIYLPCLGSLISISCKEPKTDETIIPKFIGYINIYNNERQPKNIRMSALQAISNSCLVNPCTEKSFLIPLLFNLNQLMGDEESDIQIVAGNIMAKFLNMEKIALHYIHSAFCDYISSSIFTRDQLEEIAERLLSNLFYKYSSSLNNLIEQELKTSNILFPPESDNPRRESLVDIQRASNTLRQLPLNSSQVNSLLEWLKDNLKDFNSNLGWWTGKAPIFSHLIRIFAALDNLSVRKIDVRSHSTLLSRIKSNYTNHPLIFQLFNDFESSRGFYIKNIIDL